MLFVHYINKYVILPNRPCHGVQGGNRPYIADNVSHSRRLRALVLALSEQVWCWLPLSNEPASSIILHLIKASNPCGSALFYDVGGSRGARAAWMLRPLIETQTTFYFVSYKHCEVNQLLIMLILFATVLTLFYKAGQIHNHNFHTLYLLAQL